LAHNRKGNPNAAIDAAVAGFNGTIYNVKINLSRIRDTNYVFTKLNNLFEEKIG